MKPYILSILLAIFFLSCEKTITEIQIKLKNETNDTLNIKLFPGNEYLFGDNSYSFSAFGGGHNPTTFELEIDSIEPRGNDLYSTDNLNVSATELACQVFDSILVTLKNDQQTTMVFTREGVEGYARNLFTDDSAWSYELNTYYVPVGLSRTTIEAHEYTFTIKEENIE